MTPAPSTRAPYPLAALFLLLVVATATLGYRYALAQRDAVEREVHKQLLAIADMKIKDISAWRLEKLGEARMILNSGLTLAAVKRLVEGRSDAGERATLTTWMDALCRELHYAGITLTDPAGHIVAQR